MEAIEQTIKDIVYGIVYVPGESGTETVIELMKKVKATLPHEHHDYYFSTLGRLIVEEYLNLDYSVEEEKHDLETVIPEYIQMKIANSNIEEKIKAHRAKKEQE